MKNYAYPVSVIVPIYNSEQYLTRCLESIISQSYKNIQIILVNDGSTDCTREICEKYMNKDKRVTLINQNNEGASSARLTGVKFAHAEYIAFIDSDDWVEPFFIEELMNQIQDADIICTEVLRIYENGNTLSEKNSIETGVYQSKDARKYIYERMLYFDEEHKFGILPYAVNKLFKKSILLPILETIDKRIFDGEDVSFILPYLLKAKKIIISDYCGYNYFFRKKSISNRKRETVYYNESCLYVWLYEILKNSEYSNKLIAQLNKYFLMMIWKRNPAEYIAANKFVFPYYKIACGSSIILYGDGDVGGAYYQELNQNKYCHIKAIADKKYQGKSDGFKISPEEITAMEFDYIVIAIIDEIVQKAVEHYLIEIGIDKKRIVY